MSHPKGKNDKIVTRWILESREDREKAIKFCRKNKLKVIATKDNHLKVEGKTRHFSKLFKTEIHNFVHKNGSKYHSPLKELSLPKKVKDIIGLDTKPKFRPYFHVNKSVESRDIAPKALSTFTPLQLAQLYNFPAGDGTGQTIGIIELGGGLVLSDVQHYFTNLGITTSPKITIVSVNGGQNNPADTNSSVEVILDVEIIAALVPQADVRVYFAPNSDAGFYNAISQAISDGCGIVSISWGASENNWSSTTMNSFNSLFSSAVSKGVTILAASGDNGSSDGSTGNNVDFPGSCPFSVSCGGTRLIANGNVIASEVVWDNNSVSSATGGGLSAFFPTPSYQANLVAPLNGKRAVPDIAANADPQTGYIIYGQGEIFTVGGTSCVSPLFSALIARVNQNLARNVGFIHPTLYSSAGGGNVCRDITSGNNGFYNAGVGYDLCTGFGSPNGQSFLNLFKGGIVSPPPTPAPVANFSVNTAKGTAPLSVSFTNSSTNSTSWLWNFGDSINNTSTLQNPSHIYQTTGNYSVSLIATGVGGSNTLTKTNYIVVSSAPPPSPPPLPPVASFSVNKTSGTTPLTVQFTNSSTNSTSWSWIFGDGSVSSLQNPSHTYVAPGNYSVSLIATGLGGSNTLVKSNYIVVSSISIPKPVANFVVHNNYGRAPLMARFTNFSQNATSWLWNFGDNNTSTLQNPTHVYTRSGVYSIALTATNSNGSNKLTKTNYIIVK